MSVIVKTIARLTSGLIFLFAAYSIIDEQLRPGGGFPGGIIFALCLILLLLSYGKGGVLEKLPDELNKFIERTVSVISVALLLLAGGYFLYNILSGPYQLRPFSIGIVPFCNFFIAINVGLGLFSVFSAMVLFRSRVKETKQSQKGRE